MRAKREFKGVANTWNPDNSVLHALQWTWICVNYYRDKNHVFYVSVWKCIFFDASVALLSTTSLKKNNGIKSALFKHCS